MDLYKLFKRAEVETRGVWIDYGCAKFKLARAGGDNKKFLAAMTRLAEPHKQAIAHNTLSEDDSRAMLAQAYAEAVILDWEGVTDENGAPLQFSVSNAVKLLKDLPDLFIDLKEQAEQMTNFREGVREEAAKNSGTS